MLIEDFDERKISKFHGRIVSFDKINNGTSILIENNGYKYNIQVIGTWSETVIRHTKLNQYICVEGYLSEKTNYPYTVKAITIGMKAIN